jgi:hypothetical protein
MLHCILISWYWPKELRYTDICLWGEGVRGGSFSQSNHYSCLCFPPPLCLLVKIYLKVMINLNHIWYLSLKYPYYVSPSNEGRHIVLVWFFLLPLLPLLLSEACPDHNFFVFPDRSMMWVHDHKAVCRINVRYLVHVSLIPTSNILAMNIINLGTSWYH